MRRYTVAGLVGVILLGVAPALSADEKLYHLSKVPKFRVGNRAVARQTDVSENLVTTSDGKIVNNEKTRRDTHIICEVTKVDKTGRIQAFRTSIISSKAKFDILVPRPSSKKMDIEKVHFIARRKGMEFEADTATIISEKDKTLKASQIWLLKQHCKDGISFPMYSEDDVLLMPTNPVPVGHKWKPTRKVLDKWTEASAAAKDVGGKALSAEFRFVSVTGHIVLVEGNITVEANLGGKRVKMTANLIARIDTSSGRWVSAAYSGPIVLKIQHLTWKTVGRFEGKATFKPGRGKVSALPRKLFKLGWKRPGKDTNNHIDKAKGFSLNVPKAYAAKKVAPGGSIIAQFVDKRGSVIAVTENRTDYPVDVDDIVRGFLASMRKSDSLPDYAVIKQDSVTLAHGVPAVLITGKVDGGKIIILTIIAIDGKRIVSVSTRVQVGMKDQQAELEKAMKALRLFEPDYTKAP